MTLIELSHAVSKAYGLADETALSNCICPVLLYEDHARLFELCLENHIMNISLINIDDEIEIIYSQKNECSLFVSVSISDHETKKDAACLCMLKALAKLKGI